MKLFESIKPLFTNKPLIVVVNKVDVLRLEELSPEKRAVLKTLEDDETIPVLEMSTVTDFGVMEVKIEACERLLSYRVDQKTKSKKVKNELKIFHFSNQVITCNSLLRSREF